MHSTQYYRAISIGTVPLCGPTISEVIGDSFVDKSNPEVFGDLNMHDNKIINLKAGVSNTDGANVGQSGSGSRPTTVGMYSSLVSNPDTPLFTHVGNVPLGGGVYLYPVPITDDIIQVMPGFINPSVQPTMWSQVDTTVPTLNGVLLGPMWSLQPPVQAFTARCRFICSFTTPLNVTAILSQFDTITQRPINSEVLTLTRDNPNEVLIDLPINITDTEQLSTRVVALRLSIASGAVLNISSFRLMSLYIQ